MTKKLVSLALSGVLACSLTLPAAAQTTAGAPPETSLSEESAPLPDSVLYYGTVEAISRDENGEMTSLHMSSDRYGEYVMNLSEDTAWIDSGNRAASDPATLKEGEGLYVFHSPVATLSLPPQSAAFAIVRNIPQDAGCAQYHKVSETALEDGQLKIAVDRGGLSLLTDDKTEFSFYGKEGVPTPEDIASGSRIVAWYDAYAAVYPGQTYARHVMVLDREEEALTRSGLAVMLHTAQGSPVVNYAMNFSDVGQDAPYAEAVRWAASERLIFGYGEGRFGPDDPVTREQLAVILWRQAGKPMLMDYPGLTKYSDVGDISRFAQPAMVWAHQKGLVPTGGRLGPRDTVTSTEAEQMMRALSK